jgi:hypothetical protein
MEYYNTTVREIFQKYLDIEEKGKVPVINEEKGEVRFIEKPKEEKGWTESVFEKMF